MPSFYIGLDWTVEEDGWVSWFSFVQISGQKMKTVFQKILHLFEELEEGGESTTLTISSKRGKSSIKLVLESPPSPPPSTTTSTSPTANPAPARHRHHHGARARARRRQWAADPQGATLAASASVSPSPPELLLPIPHLTNAFNQHLILWWGQQQREYL